MMAQEQKDKPEGSSYFMHVPYGQEQAESEEFM
jgi:hypothetical protein